jgi:hypothetical protein
MSNTLTFWFEVLLVYISSMGDKKEGGEKQKTKKTHV